MDFGWHAFFKKPACSFHFRVPPFRNSFVIPPGGFSDVHGREVLQHGPLIFGRENNGIEAVSAAAQFSVNAWCTDSHVTGWKIKHSWNVVRIITCPQAHHLSDTFLLGNHLERVKSSNEFYYSKVFLTSFLPRLKPLPTSNPKCDHSHYRAIKNNLGNEKEDGQNACSDTWCRYLKDRKNYNTGQWGTGNC